MRMVCASCKREIDVANSLDSCPFCGGTSLCSHNEAYDYEKDNARIEDDLNWMARKFEEEHARKEKATLWAVAGIVIVFLIISFSTMSGMKRAALIKKYGNEIVEAIENGDYETARDNIDDLSRVGNDKKTLLAVSDYNNQMVQHCIKQAEEYASRGEYEAAIQYIRTFNEITGLSGADSKLKEYYKYQALGKLEGYLAREDYEGAGVYLQKVIGEYELDDADIIEKLSYCKLKSKNTLIASAQEMSMKNNYDEAISLLNKIQDPDADVQALIYSNKKAGIEQKLAAFESAGDIPAAIVLLKDEMSKSPELVDEYDGKYESYAEKFRESLFLEAEGAYKSGTYEDAIAILENKGYPVLGKTDIKLNEKIEHYKSFKPVSLTELNPYKGYQLKHFSITDAYGDNYSKAICDDWDDTDINNSYRVSGKYSRLEFRLVVDEDYKNRPNDTGVHIYCDGREVYSYVSDNEDREPVDIVVPIEGVQDLQIYVGRERQYGRHMVATDMVLYP